MSAIDIIIFLLYFTAMLGIGFYFFRKNESVEDYFVGSRKMKSWHVGLSVVATDVGGGFSIGLGGLGFAIGISGSWMLLTGLIGAWFSAIILIPRVSKLAHKYHFLTFPQLFEHFYNNKIALLAGIISAIGYIGFTSSQLLAGAKLASATFPDFSINEALFIMGIIAIVYTSFGGMKAVIYTDTVQWIILMSGLIFIGIPVSYFKVGGYEAIRDALPAEFLSLNNITWQQMANWFITIIPIWFVGMTLYQRIYATKNEKSAQKAWFIAGIFEYPLMAFMGVSLGLIAKVAFINGMFSEFGLNPDGNMDPEMGIPVLLNHILPIGLIGLMLSAYFSAILSTADSCLMAASGNVQTDIFEKLFKWSKGKSNKIRLSQTITLVIGIISLLLASKMTNVLDLMLNSYAFMVSGLFIPTIMALFTRNPRAEAALFSMIIGGGTTITLNILKADLYLNLDANIYGISASLITYLTINILIQYKNGVRNIK